MSKELITLNNWEKAKQAIAVCKNIDEVKQIRDKAEALRAYAKQAKEGLEVQNNIADIKLRAERKIGEFSKELPKENKWSNSHDGKLSLLKNAGIQHYERYESIANLPEALFNKHIEDVKKSNEELTTIGIIKLARDLEKKSDIERQKEDIKHQNSNFRGLYDVIMMDVPWQYGTTYSSNGRRVASPYPEMSIDEIKNLKIPAKENSIMFFWTTHKFLKDSFDILEHYGFDYKGIIVWNKQKMGMGEWLRMQCEFCLLGIKGNPLWDIKDIRDIIEEPRREHSRKPETLYNLINNKLVGKKLDYFSREERDGWDNFGNDKNKFNG